jgi:hypothetical protein
MFPSLHRFIRQSRRGSALVMVMIFTIILSMMAVGLARYATYQTVDRARYEMYKDEFAAAEVALNKAYAQIQHMVTFGTPNFDDEIAAIGPPTVAYYKSDGSQAGDIDFSTFNVTNTFDGMDTIDDPTQRWYGLNLYQRRYRVDVVAKKTGGTADTYDAPGVTASQNLEIRFIPLYLFAIFYDPVMEIAPGPYMQVNGMVHANGNAYFQSNTGLDFMKDVTVAGDVFHGRHPNSGQSNSNAFVNFINSAGASVNMNTGSTWLDSTVANWGAMAQDRWNGHFKNSAHGVQPLSLPIPAVDNPHSIIERADPANDSNALQQEKFEYKAGMKIVRLNDGSVVGVNSSGDILPLTYTDPANPGNTKSIYKITTFYDAREGKNVDSIDIDLGNMIEANTISTAAGGPSLIPENGILYVSNEDQGTAPGVVRLVNGSLLPQSPVTEGFTVATDDPIYVKGDFNTVNQTLSMVAGDALYILSNAWQDANSATYSSRVASATEVNTVCMHGIVETANKIYSGGVENNFRFLENWSGKDFVFNGSIVIMWASQKALGVWGKSNVYSPPRRIWAWDTALGGVNGPPGAPRVVELEKKGWQIGNIHS